MKYELERPEKNQVKFTFTLTPEEWETAVGKAYEKNKHKYSQPGFRKGKVPRKVIEGLYGKGFFYEDAFNECFPDYYGEALDKEPDVFPVDRPDVDITEINEKGVTFTAVATVKPEVKLGAYTGISYKKPEYIVTEDEVEEELKKAQDRLGRLVDVQNRAAKEGDTTVIDYSGAVDGVKFDGGTAENQTLELGSHSFIPGFEEGVAGMKIGEEKDVSVKFPEDYHAEELKGKDAVFHVALHEIKEKELPKLDDDFAKDVSEFDTLQDYRKDIRKKLTEDKKKRAETASENELVDKIVAAAAVEIPDCMIEHEIDDMVQEMEYRFMYQGLKMEDYFKYTGTTMEELRKGHRDDALRHVKTRLVIETIIKNQKFEAKDKAVDKKIAELAEAAKKDPESYRKEMPAQQMEYVKNGIVMDQLFEYLKKNNAAE